ncbi:G-D-S-L family lipolytic protein [Algibacter amylolyticus]|uniref:G-D-S-L family lipolytic protein n=2 Tax=Algibacter amylolyticus TaxID=1608400 RepID=A0A5M7BBZ1_9FLAO|nr:G-D-S-L family lipolytic protein [Algibacter amylolyticus]TSJ81518.1 G-D-S-L family lipolytic protein [Algibacter amylolyticus]
MCLGLLITYKKTNMKNIKYLTLIFGLIAFVGCNEPEDVLKDTNIEPEEVVVLPELITGSTDFSTYVSIGNSLTAGFTDNALFKASQENSFPNILSQKFAMIGGGDFNQPLTNDNFGGIALGGNRILEPRLVTTGGAPVSLESVIGPVTVTTDVALNNPTGPFNNMGVPGAKSFHLLAPGYGNISGLLTDPATANPYFVRMTGTTPDASILQLAMAQTPTFFSLWIGNNDVLGYATTGGDGTNPITPVDGAPGVGFTQTYGALIATLTAGGAKGVIANIPYVTDIPHFTTVPYNALDPNDEDNGPALIAQIPTLNTVYGALNQIFNLVDPSRVISFSSTEANGVVIKDETLADLSSVIRGGLLSNRPAFEGFIAQFGLAPEAADSVATLFGIVYGQARQATADDLFVLPSLSIIGEVNETQSAFLQSQDLPEALADQFSAEGVTFPLADKWVLIPSEQDEIKKAVDAFNLTIETAATNAGLAFVDANSLLSQLATTGIETDNFILKSNLVTGGAFSLDGVHLTSRGYAMAANEFMKAIDAAYGTNFEASGNLVNTGNYPTNYSPLLQ